jgi:hypothetical protein
MDVITNRCEGCGASMKALAMLISGFAVFSCKACRRLRIEDDNCWLAGGPGAAGRIEARARLILEARQKTRHSGQPVHLAVNGLPRHQRGEW